MTGVAVLNGIFAPSCDGWNTSFVAETLTVVVDDAPKLLLAPFTVSEAEAVNVSVPPVVPV